MHKWSANVITADGRSFRGRVKIISERLVTVNGHSVALAQHTPCWVGVILPREPGAAASCQVELQCCVTQVIFSSDGVRLAMSVEKLPSTDTEIFLGNIPKVKR
jgi:hypothetical protein